MERGSGPSTSASTRGGGRDGVLAAAAGDSGTVGRKLVQLEVTEVLVMGLTSVGFSPFAPGTMENPTHFVPRFHRGDVDLFAFELGLEIADCPGERAAARPPPSQAR